MGLRPRYTEQLPISMTPSMREQLERIHDTDPAAPSLAAAGRLVMDLGLKAYSEQREHAE